MYTLFTPQKFETALVFQDCVAQSTVFKPDHAHHVEKETSSTAAYSLPL